LVVWDRLAAVAVSVRVNIPDGVPVDVRPPPLPKPQPAIIPAKRTTAARASRTRRRPKIDVPTKTTIPRIVAANSRRCNGRPAPGKNGEGGRPGKRAVVVTFTVTEAGCTPSRVTGFGEAKQVAPEGASAQAKETEALNPLLGTIMSG